MTKEEKCPRCGNKGKLQALSRKDNKTMICNPCGTAEALEDMVHFHGFKK